MKHRYNLVVALALLIGFAAPALANSSGSLAKAVNSDFRKDQREARDQYRNPQTTLEFFGFQDTMTVVEIWPGGGWYTDILAPALKAKGKLIAAHFDAESPVDYYKKSLESYKKKIAANKDYFGDVEITVFNPPSKLAVAAPNSADMVLTFRNVHNWYMNGDEAAVRASFQGFFDALKPGGVLGVVEHRLPEKLDQVENKRSGYMKQSLVIKWAEEAGFKLVAQSEINANPKDTAQHPNGVWTLPPRLRADEDKLEHYRSVGESDRMTLKFVKPAVL